MRVLPTVTGEELCTAQLSNMQVPTIDIDVSNVWYKVGKDAQSVANYLVKCANIGVKRAASIHIAISLQKSSPSNVDWKIIVLLIWRRTTFERKCPRSNQHEVQGKSIKECYSTQF